MIPIIYHNPQCGTSRKVLALLEEKGAVQVIEYLKTPPSRAELQRLLQQMGMNVRYILRTNVAPYDELNLADFSLSDEALLDAIEAHPILMNRPIVVTDKGIKLCRPAESVLALI